MTWPEETKLGRGAAEVKAQNDGSQAPEQFSSAMNGGGKHDTGALSVAELGLLL